MYWKLTICFFAIVASLVVATPIAGRLPNVLLIVSDDQGYGDLGCYANAHVRTPNLDRLATEGARLTNFYVAWPACTPSRASLLTGRYPQRHGLYDMIRNEAPDYGKRYSPEEYAVTFERIAGLDTREVLLSDMLKQAGYACGMVGKWDLGMQQRFLPMARGFDFFYGFVNTGIDYFTHDRYGVPSMYRGNLATQDDRGQYSTWLFELEASRFIRDNADRPFFLYLGFNAPHGASSLDPKVRGAAQATAELQKEYPELKPTYERSNQRGKNVEVPSREHRRLNHVASLTGMDQSIGRLLELLDELQISEDTVVIYMSDNGAAANGDNGPLRGGKGDLWEGGVRVSCMVRYPEMVPAKQTCDAFLTSLEVVPSVLRLAGVSAPKGLVLDGRDWWPALKGKPAAVRNEMFWQRRNLKAARIKGWKWISTAEGEALFDLSNDLGEQHDLAEKHPEIVATLRGRFEGWQREMSAAEPRDPFRDY